MNNNLWKILHFSQFIHRDGEDCEHQPAQNTNENDSDHVHGLAVNSESAEDEAEVIEIMNTSVALHVLLDEAAAVLM